MATFQQWLTGHEGGPQDSPVAWLARQWKALEGKRPRVSSPSGIERHLLTLAPPEAAEADQWTGYVHQAVAEATQAYKTAKAREQAGSDTSSGQAQQPMPGMDQAAPRRAAVVSSTQWRQHPDASQMGSCYECGWPRGLAELDVPGAPGGRAVVMTCAAGHVFTPQKPEPVGPTAPGPAGSADGEAVVTLSGPLTPTAGPGGAGLTREQVNEAESFKDDMTPPEGHLVHPDSPAGRALAEQGMEHVTDQGQVDLLGLVNLKLTAILVSLGLPTDPDGLMALLVAADEQQQAEAVLLSDQLAQGMIMDGNSVRMNDTGTMPPDFAAWYGIADPAAEATE